MPKILAEYEEWLKKPRESWEIEAKLRQFEEAFWAGNRAINSEKWDKERKKRMEKGLEKLIKQMNAFKKLKWKCVKYSEKT